MSDNQHEEGLDNTNAIASIVETGDLHEVSMILGNRERIRHVGVIRPGIKVLLRDATDAQKKLYEQMLNEGHGFDAIDAELLKIAPKGYTKKTCLMPSNCDYFVVRDEDFKRPSDAEYIRKNYADPDGKVRRIPCWLPVSDIEKAIPHNFRAFDGGANLRCVSFYEGSKMKFRYLPKDTKLPAKQEDWKILDTDDEEKATKACGYKVVFGGMYRVYVPGVRSAGEIVIPTRSWYGLGESVSILRRVRHILGRFNGLFNGNAFFELCKVAETVKTPDGRRQQQWIVTLELAVDPMELARYAEPQAVANRSLQALSLLTGKVPHPVVEEPETDALPADLGPTHAPQSEPTPSPEPAAKPAEEFDRRSAIMSLSGLVMPHKLTLDEIIIYAASQGMGEDVNEMSRGEMVSLYKHVKESLGQDADGFAAMVRDIAGTEQMPAADGMV